MPSHLGVFQTPEIAASPWMLSITPDSPAGNGKNANPLQKLFPFRKGSLFDPASEGDLQVVVRAISKRIRLSMKLKKARPPPMNDEIPHDPSLLEQMPVEEIECRLLGLFGVFAAEAMLRPRERH